MINGKKTKKLSSVFLSGFSDGIPIGLGYLSVSFSFGLIAAGMGIPWPVALLISMTNLTSAGQFEGINLICAGAAFSELALTELIINIRYSLMSVSLSQKLGPSMTTPWRLFCSFFVTDEIFAVASQKDGTLSNKYLCGLGLAPFLGWSLGTLLGALAGNIMPPMLRSALGIALYAMFIAIVIPPARKNRAVAAVALIAVAVSCAFRFIPALSSVSHGFVIIICAVSASAAGALLFPVADESAGAAEAAKAEEGADIK